jgi:hypothetical protein
MIFANFTGLFNGAVNRTYEPNIEHFRASSIARAETRYLGDNYAGFNDPEFERLATAWDSALDKGQRHTLAIQITQRLADALPAFGLYCAVFVTAVAAPGRGPTEIANNSNAAWNIQDWQWRS